MPVLRKILIATACVAAAGGLVACGGSSHSSGGTSPAATDQGTTSPFSSPSTPASHRPAAHATEFNPPGDIPDNQVFVDFRVSGSKVHIRVPEGWARSTRNGVTTFTDHYNSIAIQVVPRASRPSVASVSSVDVPSLRQTVPRFAKPQVSRVTRRHGAAVRLTYDLDSAPNQVTGKVVRDAAERYAFWQNGEEAVLTLTGPRNADNVDPWRTVSDSLQWR